MNKIIYVSISPLIPFVQKYLRIQEIIAAGFEVEFWDLSAIYSDGSVYPDTQKNEHVRNIDSLAALKDLLRSEDLQKTIFVLQVHYEWKVLQLYLLMSRMGCTTAYFPWTTHSKKPLKQRVVSELRLSKFWHTFLNMFARFVKKTGLVRKYDLVFTAGRLNRDAYQDHKLCVDINYIDYDLYLSNRLNVDRIVQGEYCVFIDEGCVDNPNVKFLDLEEMDPDRFYGALRRFFDHIENSCNLRVVIAAHPGIQYDRSTFGGREIFEGKTCDLIRDASLVVSQSSTATSFAVFYMKPLLFVYTKEYASIRRTSYGILEYLAHELGAESYNIDLDKELRPVELPIVDRALYTRYKFTSFTSESTQDKQSAEIIAKSFLEL